MELRWEVTKESHVCNDFLAGYDVQFIWRGERNVAKASAVPEFSPTDHVLHEALVTCGTVSLQENSPHYLE